MARAVPRSDLCSTQFCLVNPGSEYLFYLPGAGSVNANLAPGNYNVEWFEPSTNRAQSAGIVAGGSGVILTSPYVSDDAVVYLRAQ